MVKYEGIENKYSYHNQLVDENGHELDRQKTIDLNVPDLVLPNDIKKVIKKDDWKTLDMPEQYEMFVLDKVLTENDIKILKNGHKPEAMEDKWFWYAEADKLYIHRSWTGVCIYIVDLDTNGHLDVLVNRNMEQYKETDIEKDKHMVSQLLNDWTKTEYNYYEQFITETHENLVKQGLIENTTNEKSEGGN